VEGGGIAGAKQWQGPRNSPTTTSSIPTRPWSLVRRFLDRRGRHHQARQPLRSSRVGERSSGLLRSARWPATAGQPSVALLPSTGPVDATVAKKPGRRLPGGRRRGRRSMTRRSDVFKGQADKTASAAARAPGSPQLALEHAPDHGRFSWCRTADHTGDTLGRGRAVVTSEEPRRREPGKTCSSRGRWPSTCGQTPSCWRIRALPSASAAGPDEAGSRRSSLPCIVPAPRAAGSVLASDGFFPYPDGVEVAGARAGVRAIRPARRFRLKDSEAIAVADGRRGRLWFLPGERHFKH